MHTDGQSTTAKPSVMGRTLSERRSPCMSAVPAVASAHPCSRDTNRSTWARTCSSSRCTSADLRRDKHWKSESVAMAEAAIGLGERHSDSTVAPRRNVSSSPGTQDCAGSRRSTASATSTTHSPSSMLQRGMRAWRTCSPTHRRTRRLSQNPQRRRQAIETNSKHRPNISHPHSPPRRRVSNSRPYDHGARCDAEKPPR